MPRNSAANRRALQIKPRLRSGFFLPANWSRHYGAACALAIAFFVVQAGNILLFHDLLKAGRTGAITTVIAHTLCGNLRLSMAIGAYALCALALHILAAVGITAGLKRVIAFRTQVVPPLALTVLIQLCAVAGTIAWNQRLFPLSHAMPSGLWTNDSAAQSIFLPVGVFSLVLLLVGIFQALRSRLSGIWSVAIMALAGFALFLPWNHAGKTAAGDTAAPNIVLIGLDSVRPDFIYGSQQQHAETANLDRFLSGAVIYPDALTPAARTFPSWISLLTGQYPVRSGIRFNLQAVPATVKPITLANQLKGRGYYTVYATDEVRFANIDSTYGFDRVITPPPGVLDFLAGAFIDFAPLNLAIMLPPARYMFPHLATNRAAPQSYRPQAFNGLIRHTLRSAAQPLFLAVHFCVPHWPYWQATRKIDIPMVPDFPNKVSEYSAALRVVDAQFGELIGGLEDEGILQNALVFVFSDHGESLGLQADQILDAPTRIGFGHGTIAYSDSQYKVLLAVQRYRQGIAVVPQTLDSRPASLLDISATVYRLLGVQPAHTLDGFDLLSPEPATLRNRLRYTETDLRSDELNNGDLTGEDLLKQFGMAFRIKRDGRIEMRPEQIDSFVQSKQFAVHHNGRALVSDPVVQGVEHLMHIDYRRRRAAVLSGAEIESKQWSRLRQALCKYRRVSPRACGLGKVQSGEAGGSHGRGT